MSILSGFFKTKKLRRMADGNYKLQSEWTSSETVEMADGNTAEENLGSIKGITSSLASTDSGYALAADAGKDLQDQVNELNSNLTGIDISSGVTALATFKIDSIDLKLRGNHVSGNIVVSLQSGGVFHDSYVLKIPKEYVPKFTTPITANGYLNSDTKYLPGYGIIDTDGRVLFYSNNETNINIAYISFSYDI